jgi:hypothetical protein
MQGGANDGPSSNGNNDEHEEKGHHKEKEHNLALPSMGMAMDGRRMMTPSSNGDNDEREGPTK